MGKKIQLFPSIALLVVLTSSHLVHSQTQTFSVGGSFTWTAPSCVTSVDVEVWGGGGGGGGGDSGNGGSGAGGGGYSKSTTIAVVAGTVYNLQVGAGGTSGMNGTGGSGGDSWFINATTILARGGSGGNRSGAGGLGGAIGIGSTTYAGGNGGNAYDNGLSSSGGGGGSSAGTASNGNNGTAGGNGIVNAAGGTAPAGGGAGGRGGGEGGDLTDENGFPGSAPGGGGGGTADDDGDLGGAGGAGKVVLTWTAGGAPPNMTSANTANVCSGVALNLALVADVANSTFTWIATDNANTTGESTTTQTTGTINNVIINITNVPQTVTYTVTPTSPGGCTGPAQVVTITVNPAPQINSMTASSCAGASFTSTPTHVTDGVIPTGTTYAWGLPTVTGGVTGATTGTGQASITQTLSNPTNASQTATYNITPTSGAAGSCVGASFTLTASLSAPVSIFDYSLTAVCSGNPFSLTPSTGVPTGATVVAAGTTYDWSAPTVTGGMTGGSAQTNQTTISQTFVNTTTTRQTATYNVTPYSGGCPSASFTVVVPVDPSPTGTISGTTAVCEGATSPNVVFTGTVGNPPFTFTYQIDNGANLTVTGNPANVPVLTATQGAFTYSLVSVSDAVCSQPQTGSAIVTVDPLPTASISGTTTVCLNYTPLPDITFTGADGTAPYTFTYNINGNVNQTISTTSGNSVTVPAPTNALGTFTYALVSVQDANCTNTASGSAIINVDPPPTATISGTTSVCKDDPQPLITFTGSAGTPPYTFTYNINGGASQTISSGGGNTATVFVPTGTEGDFDYELTGVGDASGMSCGAAIDNAIVTIIPLPTVSVVGTTAVCINTPEPTITFTGLVGSPPYTFTYTINGGTTQTITTTGGSSSVSITAPTNTVGTFTYTTSDASSTSGCNSSISQSAIITVDALPTATMSGGTTVCQNAPDPDITFTGANGTVPYTFTYTLNGGGNQTISTTGVSSSVTLAVPTTVAGTNTYALVSVQDASLSACSNPATGNEVVTINPAATAAISGTTEVCNGGTFPDITFTGSNGTAPYTFTYSINGGANQTINTTGGSSSVTVAASTAASGAFTYSLAGIQDANLSACGFASGTATVTVNPLPTASIIGTTTICQNAAEPNIVFSGVAGTAPFTFTYTINGGVNQTISSTGGGSTATITAPTTIAGTYTYDLVSVLDGSSTACSNTATGSAIVTVDPAPTANITGTTAVCNGATSPNITFTGSGGNVPYTFTYTINGGASQTATTTGGSSSVTVAASTAASGVFTYSLVGVQDANLSACGSASGSAIVTVNPLPTATISGSTAVCKGSASPNITFTAVGFAPPYTFTYTLNGANQPPIVTASGNSVSIAAPTTTEGTYTYDLVSIQDANCSQAQTGSEVVTINPLPVVTVNSTSICAGLFTTLIASGANTYAWSTGSLIDSTTVKPNSPTTYTVTGTSSLGCVSSGFGRVTVYPIPRAQFSSSPNPALMLSPEVNFTNLSSPDITNWLWNFGDGDSLATTSPNTTHMYPSDTATYTATLIVFNEGFCYDTITHLVEIGPEFGFYIPNAFSPDGDLINDVFLVKGTSFLEFSMSIYDRWGNFIFYSDDINEGWDGKANLGSEIAQRDVYVYSIRLVDFKKKVHNYRGTITLVK